MIKIQVKLDDKTRELIGEDADQYEEPIECKAYLLVTFKDGSHSIRACGRMSVAEIAAALADVDDQGIETAIRLAAALTTDKGAKL